MSILIRPFSTNADYHDSEALQHRAWAMDSDLDVVPLHMLLAVQKNGGVLLGAFDNGVLVGFVFGYPGLTAAGEIKHCSHMMGVAPEYRSRGVGQQLKLAQRQFVLDQGIDLVTWTYDPLESRNAYLNIHKLGAVCRTYIRDYYGPMADGLNVGLPSDRLRVNWWISSERVRQRALEGTVRRDSAPFQLANNTGQSASGHVTPGALHLDLSGSPLGIEIPVDYQSIKGADRGLALAWRKATRTMLEVYFGAGYLVVDLVNQWASGERRSFYVLRRE